MPEDPNEPSVVPSSSCPVKLPSYDSAIKLPDLAKGDDSQPPPPYSDFNYPPQYGTSSIHSPTSFASPTELPLPQSPPPLPGVLPGADGSNHLFTESDHIEQRDPRRNIGPTAAYFLRHAPGENTARRRKTVITYLAIKIAVIIVFFVIYFVIRGTIH